MSLSQGDDLGHLLECRKFLDSKLRCPCISHSCRIFQNQIQLLSINEKEKKVVQTVFEKLYTPYGLRTLSMDDEEFKGFYGGEQFKRDLAYHQGTVWAFPLGGYYVAYLKVNGEFFY